MKFNEKVLREKIATSLRDSVGLSRSKSEQVAFHMTDWLADFEDLSEVLRKPERYSAEQVYDALMKFLVHAPEHISAASEIFTGFPVINIFRNLPWPRAKKRAEATRGDRTPRGKTPPEKSPARTRSNIRRATGRSRRNHG